MTTQHTLPTHPDCLITGMLVDYKHGEHDSVTFAVYQTNEGTWRAASTTDAATIYSLELRGIVPPRPSDGVKTPQEALDLAIAQQDSHRHP